MDIGFALTVLGLVVVLAGAIAYLILLFVVHGFTYRTWIFHGVVAAGMALAVTGWVTGGSAPIALLAGALGVVWFFLARRELRLVGSKRLTVRRGDPMPAFTASTTDGGRVTEQDLVSKAPRCWFCIAAGGAPRARPSSTRSCGTTISCGRPA